MENNKIHSVSIINNEIKLDNFKVEGVLDYNLKRSGKGEATLNLTLLVRSQEVEIKLDGEEMANTIIPLENTKFINELSNAIGEKWVNCSGEQKGLPLFSKQDELERAEKIVHVLEGMSIESAQEILSKINKALLQLIFIS
ncbi:hypothetical protein SAMN02745163_02091 [Clostridium cavendishii DSM 21758]|uniref:Uncharacterized protein n=1 Tax=Clostridium cavendishii DSM 21758 TaxID=1121302 RepID=A0A1M6K456_9CLOT|nr:hypothetical protein [Clostridium cavendishii]SHJ53686.1 hypothetical protein SAMN02745163_02091 [Clostridium cavendishii DSM 21758]